MNKTFGYFILLLTLCCFTKNGYSGNIHKQWALNLDVAAKTADTSGHIWCLTKTGYLYSIRRNGTIRDSVFVHSLNLAYLGDLPQTIIAESGFCYSAIQCGDNAFIQKTDTNGWVVWNKMIQLTNGVRFCTNAKLIIAAGKLFFNTTVFTNNLANSLVTTFSLDLYSGFTIWRYDEFQATQVLLGSINWAWCYNSTNFLFLETVYIPSGGGPPYNYHIIKFDRNSGIRLDSFTINNSASANPVKIFDSLIYSWDGTNTFIRDENFNIISTIYDPSFYPNCISIKGNYVCAFNKSSSSLGPYSVILNEFKPSTGMLIQSDTFSFGNYVSSDIYELPNGNYFLPLSSASSFGITAQTLILLLDSNFSIIDSSSFSGNIYSEGAWEVYLKFVSVINPHQFLVHNQVENLDSLGFTLGFTNYLTLIEDSIGVTQYANRTRPANTVTVLPNPANGNFQVVFKATAAGSYQLSINSLTGQTMVANKINCSSPGYYYYNFNSAAYPNGLYMVNIGQNAKSAASAKLMVVNH